MIQVKKLFKCQKAVTINKERVKENVYDVKFSAYKSDLLDAAKELNETSYKLYAYLLTNQDGYTFGLSRQDVVEQTGISSKSYDRAVKTLVDNKYLVYSGDSATDGKEKCPLYTFYSRPHP